MLSIRDHAPLKTWETVTLVSVSVATMALVLLFSHGLTETGLRLVIRATGRASFPLFLMLSLGGSLYKLWPNPETYWLLANRKYMGIAFGIIYMYHGLGFTALGIMTGQPNIEGLELILSIICYSFLVAMTVTSFRAVRRKLSPWLWDSLQGVGMLFFFYFFLQEFIGKAEEDPLIYVPMAIMTAAVMPIKIIAATKPRTPKARKAATNNATSIQS
jgi:methionine sulfoxide reductase heme-binding subunit